MFGLTNFEAFSSSQNYLSDMVKCDWSKSSTKAMPFAIFQISACPREPVICVLIVQFQN